MDVLKQSPLISSAIDSIARLFSAGHAGCIAFSGGKDSAVVALLTLLAARAAAAAGLKPIVVVTSGNTLVDNPEVENHVRVELAKMRLFGKQNGFKVITEVVTPSMAAQWAVKVLTGRGLPSYGANNQDCAIDLKIRPQRAFRRKLFKDLSEVSAVEPVVLVGTRFEESARRATKMAARGECATAPIRNSDGELVLSPIADWTADDVWEVIGFAASKLFDSYSDFAETKRIYAAAEGTSCAVVADAISSGKKRGGCGARTGCFVCQVAEDKSLEQMVNFEPRYEYARPLVRFNRFLRNIRHDWNRRHWLGRTIKAGYIAIQPDTFHPSTLRELYRYMLQMDYDELVRSGAEGTEPMFTLLPPETIIAIDAMWSMNGSAVPFSAWADYDDIFHRGVRYDIPDIEPVPETPLPVARYLYVGDDWDGVKALPFTGMRSVYVEGITGDSQCTPAIREYPDGRAGWDVATEATFSVDPESAMMILDFELENLLEKHRSGFAPGGVTFGYLWYLSYGALTLQHSQPSEHDRILRRTAFKDRHGLTYDYDIQRLLEKSLPYGSLPEEAQEAWGHKAGKTRSAAPEIPGWTQTDLFELLAA